MKSSHLVSFLLVISDRETKKELHSETVGFYFENTEFKYLRGLDTTHFESDAQMSYWLNNNVSAMLSYRFWKDNIFRTNNQRSKLEACLEKLHSNKNYIIDSVKLETHTGSMFEIKLRLDQLKKDPANILWQGEFV